MTRRLAALVAVAIVALTVGFIVATAGPPTKINYAISLPVDASSPYEPVDR